MKNGLNNNSPIGVFDSGFGGLTVLKELTKVLPSENIIYFGDTARVPYGTKSKIAVKMFSCQIAKFLMQHRVKLILVACNTASALAIDDIKKVVKNIPVIGVIKSGANAAVSTTVNKRIGIIGTVATIKSEAYQNAIKKIDRKIKIVSQPCPLFVPLVEEGWTNGKIAKDIAKKYLQLLSKANCDVIILGCTHYPMLIKIIQEVVGKNTKLIDSAKEVSVDVKKILLSNGLARTANNHGYTRFYVSDDPGKFSKFGKIFLGKVVSDVKKVCVE